jgi:hypothetical protein
MGSKIMSQQDAALLYMFMLILSANGSIITGILVVNVDVKPSWVVKI